MCQQVRLLMHLFVFVCVCVCVCVCVICSFFVCLSFLSPCEPEMAYNGTLIEVMPIRSIGMGDGEGGGGG